MVCGREGRGAARQLIITQYDSYMYKPRARATAPMCIDCRNTELEMGKVMGGGGLTRLLQWDRFDSTIASLLAHARTEVVVCSFFFFCLFCKSSI